jgi:hypothetical protein
MMGITMMESTAPNVLHAIVRIRFRKVQPVSSRAHSCAASSPAVIAAIKIDKSWIAAGRGWPGTMALQSRKPAGEPAGNTA